MSDLDSVSQGGQEGAGAYLRQAREAQGMTIEQLASTVKVPTTKLLALERNDWDVLPDANFNRALAMTVCRALKVDAGPALSRMPAAVAVSLASAKPPLNQPFRDFSHTGLTFESSPSLSLRVPKLPPALIAPLVLLILAAGIYFMPDHFDLKTLLPHSDDAASQMVQGEHGPAVTEDRPEVAQSASGASATAGGASAVDLPEIAASSSVAAVLPAASEA
ncbi:MAG TPA: helix-turn-helix domain-containing protein, partial [Aquabacterium sp.]|nr:helix-turn-helix domain-containing protein [Aquabacterium sp.]